MYCYCVVRSPQRPTHPENDYCLLPRLVMGYTLIKCMSIILYKAFQFYNTKYKVISTEYFSLDKTLLCIILY